MRYFDYGERWWLYESNVGINYRTVSGLKRGFIEWESEMMVCIV